jgi:hypothetical protein
MNGNQATNTLRLGRLVREYKASAAGIGRIIFVALVCVAIAALFFFGALSEAWSREWGGVVALSIIGLVFLLPVLLAVYVLFRGRGACLSLYENGLFFSRGGKESTTTWDEIDSYMQEMACRIVKKDGEVIEFGQGIRGADEVAQTIQDETLKLMLPKVMAAIRNGSRVEFKGWKPAEKIPLGRGLSNYMEAHSGFTVDADGITENDGGNHILWKDLTDFGITEETRGPRIKIPIRLLHIAGAKQSFRTRYGLLGNAHVLLALCAQMVSLNQPGSELS